ncbi:MAG: TetR/AcrR family transcriptional regulator [Gammaproteobacteria bacterium]
MPHERPPPTDVPLNAKAAARDTTRRKLLETGFGLVREKGYAATRVDDICAAAGVTKGAFFHHFPTKEAWGEAVAEHWSEVTGQMFATAPYHAFADPLDRVLAYLDFRYDLLGGRASEYSCVAGTLVQEVHAACPAIQAAAGRAILDHAATLVADLAAARAARCPDADFSPEGVARFTQAVLQGAFILAKSTGDAQVARDTVRHLRRHVELLFGIPADSGGLVGTRRARSPDPSSAPSAAGPTSGDTP